MSLSAILILYLAFRAKQLTCDFFLQTGWMAIVKGADFSEGGAKALAAHAGIHAIGTFIVVMIFAPHLWWLGLVDFVAHAAIDRSKATLMKKKGWGYKDRAYWWAFGIDQEAHNLTHLSYIIAIVLTHTAS